MANVAAVAERATIDRLIAPEWAISRGSTGLSGCHGKCGDPSVPFSFVIFVLAPVLAGTWIVWTHKKKKRMVKIIGCCLETCSPLLVHELHG